MIEDLAGRRALGLQVMAFNLDLGECLRLENELSKADTNAQTAQILDIISALQASEVKGKIKVRITLPCCMSAWPLHLPYVRLTC